jgi:CheY-like chemotaxis protein
VQRARRPSFRCPWIAAAFVRHASCLDVGPMTATATATPKRVLLAEDDGVSRRVLARVLREMGHEVIESADGGRLLVAITAYYKGEHRPDEVDLVVTDVNMPICSGVDILKGMRAAHWRTPVVFVTAHDTPLVREAVTTFGAVLLLKPVDLDLFERTIHEVLARPYPRSSRPPSL